MKFYFVDKKDRKYVCSFKVDNGEVEIRIKSGPKPVDWKLGELFFSRSGYKVYGPDFEIGEVRETRFYDVSELEFFKREESIKYPHWEQGVSAVDVNNITYQVKEKEDATPKSVSVEEMDKKGKLNHFFKTSTININRGNIFDYTPQPLPNNFSFRKVEGMLLGLAIGDSLGNTTEGMLPQKRRDHYGEVRDYLPNRHANNRKIRLPSDETQLAFWSLEQMLEDGEFIPDHIARKFCSGRLFGLGGSIKGFIRNYKDKNKSWFESGVKSAGNGALMRIQPVLLPHLKNPSSELWVDTALSAMITHNDSASISACVSFVNILWQALRMNSPPEPGWWLKNYIEVAKDLEVYESYKPRGGPFKREYQGPIWKFVEEKVSEAYQENMTVMEACNRWYSGAYLLETVPSVIYILMQWGDDPEEAIIRAVNDTKDSDTIGAIVGSAVGALHGKKNIPDRWISNLSGRTRKKDDGKIFDLLKEAEQIWWSG